MVNKPCWYILKDDVVMGVAEAPVNTEDLKARGYTVVASNHYEPEIQKIKTISSGVPLMKPIIQIDTSKNADGSVTVTARSDNYNGTITVFLYNRPFELAMGQSLTIVPLEGYSLSLAVNPDPTLHVEFVGGVQ